MTEEIQDRLTKATAECLSCYGEWDKDRKDDEARKTLMEAVHELRKVSARLEIEMAVSERDQRKNKPLPIPPHRSSNKKVSKPSSDRDDNAGNQADNKGPSVQVETKPKRGGGRPLRKKS